MHKQKGRKKVVFTEMDTKYSSKYRWVCQLRFSLSFAMLLLEIPEKSGAVILCAQPWQ